MKYVFQPGDHLRVKIGIEYINLKVVRDNSSIPALDNCDKCFFDAYDHCDTCGTQICSLMGNRYHFELDDQTPTENERH